MKAIIYKNKTLLSSLSLLLIAIGIIISYIYYGTEPLETVGGFICGLGLGLFLIFISLKSPENS